MDIIFFLHSIPFYVHKNVIALQCFTKMSILCSVIFGFLQNHFGMLWDRTEAAWTRGACYPLEIFVACVHSSMYIFRTIEVLVVDRFHKTCIHFQVSLCPYLKTFIITKVNNNSMIMDDWIGFLKGETHKKKKINNFNAWFFWGGLVSPWFGFWCMFRRG